MKSIIHIHKYLSSSFAEGSDIFPQAVCSASTDLGRLSEMLRELFSLIFSGMYSIFWTNSTFFTYAFWVLYPGEGPHLVMERAIFGEWIAFIIPSWKLRCSKKQKRNSRIALDGLLGGHEGNSHHPFPPASSPSSFECIYLGVPWLATVRQSSPAPLTHI